MIIPCVEPEFLFKICSLLYPILAGYAFLGQELINLIVHEDIFGHGILYLVSGTLALLIFLVCGVLYLLHLAIQQRVLSKIRLHTFTYCLLFIITNCLYSIKLWKNSQVKVHHWSVGMMIYLLTYNFTIQIIAIIQIVNNQKELNNPPSKLSKRLVRSFLGFFYLYEWFQLYLAFKFHDEYKLPKTEDKYLHGKIYYVINLIVDVCYIGRMFITILFLIGIYKKNKMCITMYFYIKFILYAIGLGAMHAGTGLLLKYNKKFFLRPTTMIYLLTFHVLYLLEIWLVLLYINHLEWQNQVFIQEKSKIDDYERDFPNHEVAERCVLDEITETQKIKNFTVSPWRFDLGDLLGEGQFGEVYKGSLRNLSAGEPEFQKCTEIAVKILKSGQVNCTNLFLSEIKSLLIVQTHPNLVQILGLAWKESRLCILMEYCTLGNLENYLREMRMVCNPNPNSVYVQAFPGNITQNELNQISQWALEIALAMEFIGTKQIIHADLATRNVLLDANKVVKLTDFGMSIRLYNYQLYAKSNAQLLPWRWMSPEALSDMKFSSKSDVWAYGVTLWEMYTFGDCPWRHSEWCSDFLGQIQNGLQLEKPELIPEDLCTNVMKHCWLVDEKKRITFPDIVEYLKEIKQQE